MEIEELAVASIDSDDGAIRPGDFDHIDLQSKESAEVMRAWLLRSMRSLNARSRAQEELCCRQGRLKATPMMDWPALRSA